MSARISFCPMCAGNLEAAEENQFLCEECESLFLIEILKEGDEGDDEEEDDDELEQKDDEDG